MWSSISIISCSVIGTKRKLRRKRKGKMISQDDDGTKEGEEEKEHGDEEVQYVK